MFNGIVGERFVPSADFGQTNTNEMNRLETRKRAAQPSDRKLRSAKNAELCENSRRDARIVPCGRMPVNEIIRERWLHSQIIDLWPLPYAESESRWYSQGAIDRSRLTFRITGEISILRLSLRPFSFRDDEIHRSIRITGF